VSVAANEQAPSEAPSPQLAAVELLLRDRTGLLGRIERGEALPGLARAAVVTCALGAAAFGASLGLHRGGWQVAFAGMKLPLVLLLTAAVCAPTLSALRAVIHGTANLQRDLALVLSALALSGLVLAALAPLVLLGVSLSAPYHGLALLVVGSCAIAGLAGLGLLVRGLRRMSGRAGYLVAVCLLPVFVLVGGQMAWTLRPYLVRPRTRRVPLVRSLEGSLLESLRVSARSARGRYVREYAPLPDER